MQLSIFNDKEKGNNQDFFFYTFIIARLTNWPWQKKLSFLLFFLIGVVCWLLCWDWAHHPVAFYFLIYFGYLGPGMSWGRRPVKWRLLCRQLEQGQWTTGEENVVSAPHPALGLSLKPVKKKKPKELFWCKDWWGTRRQAHCLRAPRGKGTTYKLTIGPGLPWISPV